MALLLHILIALASIGQATYLFFAPSRLKFHASNLLVAATFASGIYLIVSHPVQMARTCLVGLLYIGAVAVLIGFGHRRLTALERLHNRD